jgi:hypothetical protein
MAIFNSYVSLPEGIYIYYTHMPFISGILIQAYLGVSTNGGCPIAGCFMMDLRNKLMI